MATLLNGHEVEFVGQEIREEKGYSLVDVERAVGLRRSTVWQWEHDNVVPKIDALLTYADFLGVEWLDLIDVK